jgi:hypothetical protein
VITRIEHACRLTLTLVSFVGCYSGFELEVETVKGESPFDARARKDIDHEGAIGINPDRRRLVGSNRGRATTVECHSFAGDSDQETAQALGNANRTERAYFYNDRGASTGSCEAQALALLGPELARILANQIHALDRAVANFICASTVYNHVPGILKLPVNFIFIGVLIICCTA